MKHWPPCIVGRDCCFFFPAIEGFGLPVLEAMAAGLPYLTIARGGLREVAIADSWVDENDTDTMKRKALQLLSDDKIRKVFINGA